MPVPIHEIIKKPRLIFESREALGTADRALNTFFEGSVSRHERKQSRRLAERLAGLVPFLKSEDLYFLVTQITDEGSFRGIVGQEVLAYLLNTVAKRSSEGLTKFFDTLLRSVTCSPAPVSKDDRRGTTYQASLTLLLAGMHGAKWERKKPIYLPAPTKAITNLYLAAATNEKARSIVVAMYGLFYLAAIGLLPEEEGTEVLPRYCYWKLPERMVSSFTGMMEQIDCPYDQEQANLHILLAEQVIDDLLALVTILWQDITLNPRYAVRTRGADRYRVGGFLGETSASTRYFLSEGCTFPEVLAIYERPFLGGTIYERRDLSLEELQDVEKLDNYFSALTGHRDVGILNFVIDTIAYHRIVCRNPSSSTERRNRSASERAVMREIHDQVRAHFRRLMPGWAPSEDRYLAAIEQLGRLPQGFTFVSEYGRDRSVVARTTEVSHKAPVESKPLFTVSIEDILSWIE